MNTAPIPSGFACRCPRCAYPLTGLPGAPAAAEPYGAFTADERCPECALVIPCGAHCLVGGATADVVDEGGARSVTAIAIGAAILIGGPWFCIIFGVALVQAIQGGGFRRGIGFSAPVGGFGAGTFVSGIVLTAVFAGAWFALRSWRRSAADDGTGTRAGALRRRVMVVPGGLHLWVGDPSATAASRSLAGGDIRDVRGRRHIPLFRKKGAADVGAIDFVTPMVLWSQADLKRSAQSGSGVFSGTVWVQLPAGQPADAAARSLERTLRAAPATAPVAPEAVSLGAQPTPLVDGDPNRLALPAAITAATAGDPPTCPACAAALADVPPGTWWEPLPAPVACAACGLSVPAGAIVISGWEYASQAASRRGKGMSVAVVAALIPIAIVIGVVGIALLQRSSPVASLVVLVLMVFVFPILLLVIAKSARAAIPRPRDRFQACTLTWIAAPGALRVVARAPGCAFGAVRVTTIPARGISRFSFANGQGPETDVPVQTDTLIARGTASELGLVGEAHLHVPLPAELDQDVLLERLRASIPQP
jgi:hypothetical protein